VDQPATIQLDAVDQEGDEMTSQAQLDGVNLAGLGPSQTALWTPQRGDAGVHTLTVTAQDDYGGSATQTVDVLVVHAPFLP
jgi:hypothetical protein